MKKGLFTAAVIAAMMMTQPVMAQEVVEQTGEVVQQTEEDVSEPDMAADYQMETDLAAEINVFSADNNETPIVSADPTGQEGDKDAEEGDKEPEIKTGWQTEEGKTYYYDEKGNKSVGEKKIDGKWYYFAEDGVMQIGFVQLTSKRVCYGEDGAMLYGKQSVDGNGYYFNTKTGAVTTGEKKIDGKWYYFGEDAVMQTGVQTVPTKNGGKKKVCYGEDGAMLYGKQKCGDNWYYLQAKTGAMMYGEQKIDGKWYYFDRQTGIMAVGIQSITMNNGSKKTVCYGADGAMCYGEQKIDGKWYLFDYKTGVMQTGMVKLSKKTVYYGADGAMRYGEQKINGKWYYFHMRTGAMQTGLQTVPLKNGGTKTVYYGTDGTMRYGEQKIKGKWYYFQQGTGAMQIGFAKVSGKTVYYGEDGAMRYEHQLIDGDYYFHPKTGAMQMGLLDFGGDRWGFYGTDGKQIPMIDAKTAIDAAHEFFKETISDENLEIIKGHYVQYLAAEPEMVDGHSNPQYYIYAIVTEDDADFDENTDEDDVIYGDVIRVDAVTKECVYDTDVSGID